MPSGKKLSYIRQNKALDLLPKSGEEIVLNRESDVTSSVAPRQLKGYEKTDGVMSYSIICVISGGEKRERDFLKTLIRQKDLHSLRVAFISKEGQGLQPYQMQDRTLAYLDKRKNIKELFIESKRAHEEEFLEKLKKSDTALTEMAKSLHCDVADLIPLADDFSNATISTEDWHSTFSAFKKHFLNWARLRLKTTKNEIPTKNQPERGYNPNAGRRRGPITSDCGLNED